MYSLEYFTRGAGNAQPSNSGHSAADDSSSTIGREAAWWQQTADFRALVRQGIPREQRGALWFALSGASAMKGMAGPGYYQQLASHAAEQVAEATCQTAATASSSANRNAGNSDGADEVRKQVAKRARQIEKDLKRTFAGEETAINSEPSKEALRRVLTAYAVHNEETGYCQSMNLLLAHLLLQSGIEEEQAFWLLAVLVEQIVPGTY